MVIDRKESVRKIMQEMHEAISIKANKNIKREIVTENRIFSILCNDYDMEPTACAREMERRYQCDLSGADVIQIFRNRRMSNRNERKQLFQWAGDVAALFGKAVAGDRESYIKFEKKRKEPSLANGKRHDSQERMVAIMIYEKFPELDAYEDVEKLHILGNTLAKYYFYDMADAVNNVYGFVQRRERKKTNGNKLTGEQALKRIDQLETLLERSNIMLKDLQDEFEEQLEASKTQEMVEFFSKLNSEKYGCILDELLLLNKGVNELRKNNYELPVEINGLLIMVKKLIQFVRDNHINPMMKINSVNNVKASDVEFCYYEGSPFESPNEEKTIRVISPGWVYKDKEIQISRPKVKEEDNDEK